MLPEKRFVGQSKAFWANVRTISEAGGYVESRKGKKRAPKAAVKAGEPPPPKEVSAIRVYSIAEMQKVLAEVELGDGHIFSGGAPTQLGHDLQDYFKHRANVLNNTVEKQLMNAPAAQEKYQELKKKYKPKLTPPMNKQKGDKAGVMYLTAMVNMIVEALADGVAYELDPQYLTTVTRNGAPVRTLSRRLDGCFPNHVNPVGIWEVKEYYHTTTFGSRVADGVYESFLDGMELEELDKSEGVNIQHLLIVDSHFTWWTCGRSYLCRLVDLLHMGYADEILFGAEVETRMPVIVEDWVRRYRAR